jgi:chromosome segregation ATPase
MPDFEIRITTPLEMEGAKQLEEQLQRDIGKAKALGKEFGDLQSQLTRVQSSIQGAGENAHKSLEHAAHSGRALTTALRALNPELGEMGEALHLTEYGPAIAGTFALGLGFKKLSEYAEEVTKKIMEATAASIELRERFEEASVHAGIEAVAAQKKFADALDESIRKHDLATEVMQRNITLAQEEARAVESLVDARLKLREAEIAQATQRGQLTGQQGEQAARQAEREARAAKDAADDAEKKAEIDARINRGRRAGEEISADQAALGPLRAQSQRESAAIETQAGEVKAREREVEEARKAMAEANAWLKSPAGGIAWAVIHGGLINPNAGIRSARAESHERISDAATRLRLAEGNLATAEQHAGELKDEHEATTRKVASLESEIIARNDLVQKLAQEAAAIEEDLKARQQQRAQVEALNDRAQATQDRTAREARIASGKASPDDIAIEQGYATGADRAAVDALGSRVASAYRNARAGVEGGQAELHALLEQAIGMIEALAGRQDHQSENLRSRLQQLEQHLSTSTGSHLY